MTFSSKGAPWRPLGADGTWCNGKWMLLGSTFANFLISGRKVRKVRNYDFFTHFSLLAPLAPKKWKWAKSLILDGIPLQIPCVPKHFCVMGRKWCFRRKVSSVVIFFFRNDCATRVGTRSWLKSSFFTFPQPREFERSSRFYVSTLARLAPCAHFS